MNLYEEYIENVIQLAEDASRDNRLDEAKRLLESALMEEPGYAKVHAKLGDLYHYDFENMELAERHYLLAIRFYPAYQEVYSELVSMYMDHKKYKGIQRLMEQAKGQPGVDQAFVHEKLGLCAEAQGEYRKAIDHYKKGLFESLDNRDTAELKKHIKRNRYKRLRIRKRQSKA